MIRYWRIDSNKFLIKQKNILKKTNETQIQEGGIFMIWMTFTMITLVKYCTAKKYVNYITNDTYKDSNNK